MQYGINYKQLFCVIHLWCGNCQIVWCFAIIFDEIPHCWVLPRWSFYFWYEVPTLSGLRQFLPHIFFDEIPHYWVPPRWSFHFWCEVPTLSGLHHFPLISHIWYLIQFQDGRCCIEIGILYHFIHFGRYTSQCLPKTWNVTIVTVVLVGDRKCYTSRK